MKTVKPQTEKTEETLSRRKRIQREVVAWMWVILIFLLINGTLGQARVIPSGSMENTLLVGDHLIMSRIGYDAGVPFTSWHVPLVEESEAAANGDFHSDRPARNVGHHQACYRPAGRDSGHPRWVRVD